MSDTPVVVAPPPAPPYKDRRGWLIVFGIFEILIGCVMLLMIAFTVFGISRASHVSPPPPTFGPAASPSVIMAIVSVFYGALAVLFVSVGIGNLQARRWARITMLIVSWCWLVWGVLGTAMMTLLVPMIMESARQQSKTPMPDGFDTAFRVGMAAFMGLFFVVLPLIFVLFYSGKNVKATCEARRAMDPQALPATAEEPLKPLKPAVIITVIWFGMGALSYLMMLFWLPVVPLLGLMLKGWAARATIALMCAVSVWLAVNLYHQRATAWRVAVGWLVFSWASMLLTQWRGGFEEMYRSMGVGDAQMAQMLPLANYGMIFGLLFGGAFFVFLIAIRKQFTEAGTLSA